MTTILLLFLGTSLSTGLIVLVLIILTPFLNKRYAAKWKYLIWIFLALRLLVPFSGADGWSAVEQLSRTEMRTAAEPKEADTNMTADGIRRAGRIIVELPAEMTTPMILQDVLRSEENNAGITLLDVAAFVWMSGSLIFISVHVISYFYCKRQVMQKGRIVKDVHILRQASERKRELRIGRTIRVMTYAEAGSPMVIGFLNPVLILPIEQYSAEELFFILKHEMIHLKRGDICVKLLLVMANAVHWFNPVIWMMRKEAATDMELSCDERVIQGLDDAVRKAYTETLLSVLHKGFVRKTVLSTQFYGGTKIMKRRFQNILIKNAKKNGIFVLICAVILTISLGTLVGCSAAKEDTAVSFDDNTLDTTVSFDDNASEITISLDNDILETTMMLSFVKEGETERKQACLAAGDGYYVYLPDGEWQQSGSDMWASVANEEVRLWIVHSEDKSIDSADQELADNGYVTEEEFHRRKQEEDLIYHVELRASGNDVWEIFYCYPVDSEEGWGRELPVIADTFGVSAAADEESGGQADDVSAHVGTMNLIYRYIGRLINLVI